jgi:hypothetical protein
VADLNAVLVRRTRKGVEDGWYSEDASTKDDTAVQTAKGRSAALTWRGIFNS